MSGVLKSQAIQASLVIEQPGPVQISVALSTARVLSTLPRLSPKPTNHYKRSGFATPMNLPFPPDHRDIPRGAKNEKRRQPQALNVSVEVRQKPLVGSSSS